MQVIKMWEEHLNSIISVIYDDGNRIVTKTGKLTSIDEQFLIIQTQEGSEAISKSRIIRIKLQGGNND